MEFIVRHNAACAHYTPQLAVMWETKLWATLRPIGRPWHCSQTRWSNAQPAERLYVPETPPDFLSRPSSSTVPGTPKTRIKFPIGDDGVNTPYTEWADFGQQPCTTLFPPPPLGSLSPNYYGLHPQPPTVTRRTWGKRIAKKNRPHKNFLSAISIGDVQCPSVRRQFHSLYSLSYALCSA